MFIYLGVVLAVAQENLIILSRDMYRLVWGKKWTLVQFLLAKYGLPLQKVV